MLMDTGLSVSVDVNNHRELCAYKSESPIAGTGDLSVNKLGDDVTECLNIQDDRDGVRGTRPNGKCEFQKKDGATEKCFSKGTTFSSKTTSSAPACIEVAIRADAITAEESTSRYDINSADSRCLHSASLPADLKPVSAMKGSREKRGATPPQKLTVKWAPDVYDPVPTSVSHAVTNNKPQRHSKKNSKSKQKNRSKSSRGNKYKDKKQGRKRGGNSSNAGFNFPEHEEEEVVDYCEPSPAVMEFNVENPDQFCGSSFLNRYGRNLHLSSITEAT